MPAALYARARAKKILGIFRKFFGIFKKIGYFFKKIGYFSAGAVMRDAAA